MNVEKREIYIHSFSGFLLLNYNFPNVFDLLSGKFCLIFFAMHFSLFIIFHTFCVFGFSFFVFVCFHFSCKPNESFMFLMFHSDNTNDTHCVDEENMKTKDIKKTYVLHTKCIIFNIKMKCLSNDVLMGWIRILFCGFQNVLWKVNTLRLNILYNHLIFK